MISEGERLILSNQVTMMFAMSENRRIPKVERKELNDKAWKISSILNPIKDDGRECCKMPEREIEVKTEEGLGMSTKSFTDKIFAEQEIDGE